MLPSSVSSNSVLVINVRPESVLEAIFVLSRSGIIFGQSQASVVADSDVKGFVACLDELRHSRTPCCTSQCQHQALSVSVKSKFCMLHLVTAVHEAHLGCFIRIPTTTGTITPVFSSLLSAPSTLSNSISNEEWLVRLITDTSQPKL